MFLHLHGELKASLIAQCHRLGLQVIEKAPWEVSSSQSEINNQLSTIINRQSPPLLSASLGGLRALAVQISPNQKSTITNPQSSISSTPKERLLLSSILALFLILNLLTASRSPTVWQDEVMFADPAINLVLHGTWTSTAWPAQSADEFWVGNAPLYSALLAVWLKIFGIGITAVRSLNFFLTALTALLLWHWALRTHAVTKPWARLVLVALTLTGYGITFSYRSGRYDALGYLLFAFGLWAFALSSRKLRRVLLAATGFLLAWTGLQLLPYAGILGVSCLLAFRGRFLADWISAGLGALTGLGVMVASLNHIGLWKTFSTAVMGLSAAGKHTALWQAYLQDPSWLLLALLTGLILLRPSRPPPHENQGGAEHVRPRDCKADSPLETSSHRPPNLTANPFRRSLSRLSAARLPHTSILLLATAGIAAITPAILHLTGKFTVAYTWMVWLPFAILLTHLLSILDFPSARRRTMLVAGLAIAILAGLPARLAVTAFQWRDRSYDPVTRLVTAHLKPGETAYCHYQAYYAAKPIAGTIYLPSYQILSPAVRDSLDLIITTDDDENLKSGALGEGWKEVTHASQNMSSTKKDSWSLPTAQLYALRVYRR